MFAVMLGWSYHDVRTAVGLGEAQIDSAVREGKVEIDAVRQRTTELSKEVKQLQLDIDGYNQVSSKIAKVEKDLTGVKKEVIDLGNRTLRAGSLETTGSGPTWFGIGQIGCPPSPEKKWKMVLCTQGSPPALFQLTSTGELRPVSSLSPVGFQDVSSAAKQSCTAANRGTFYVEKGSAKVADKPFLCARKSDNTYDWIQLGMVP
jgi:hypothetical protein